MNTTNQNNNVTAAPSVTIAPRNPAKGVLNFVVTLTTHKDVRSYPCRSMESAIKLAERFIAGVTKPRPAAPRSPKPPAPPARRACRTGGGVSQPPRRQSGIFSAREPCFPPALRLAAAPALGYSVRQQRDRLRLVQRQLRKLVHLARVVIPVLCTAQARVTLVAPMEHLGATGLCGS